MKAKQASWLVQKIMGAGKYLTEVNIATEEVLSMEEYSIRLIYNKLRGDLPKVECRRLLCNN